MRERSEDGVYAFGRNADGQDLIEYGLLVCLIAVVAFFAITTVGSAVNTLFWQTFPSAI